MANNMRIEWNNDGFKQLLQSSGVEALVLSHAETIAGRANANMTEDSEGFRAHSVRASSRYVAYAGTTDEATRRAEAENKVLSRAVN